MNNELKRASWIELFYDVAYIALVAQLTYLAAQNHHSYIDFLYIGVIGYAIFNSWWATTANRNLHPEELASDKLLIQLQMVGAFLMSVSMAGVFEDNYLPFFLSLAGVRFLQTLVLSRMYYVYPDTRPVTYNILSGFFISTVLWIAAALVPLPYHLILIMAALTIDVLVPLTRGKGNTKRYLNVHHLHERLGLFLMLVIGESMIVVALSNTEVSSAFDHMNIILSGLGLMAAIWWLYFEHGDKHGDVRPSNLFIFLHSHGLLYISIILVSVGYKLAIEGSQSTAIDFLMFGAFGITATILLIRSTLHSVCIRSVYLIIILVLLGVGGMALGALYENVKITAFTMTTFFMIVAFLDYKKVFTETAKNLPTKEKTSFDNDVLN